MLIQGEDQCHTWDCPSDEILSETTSEEGPLVILRGGQVYRKVLLHHLLTGVQEPMLVPYNTGPRKRDPEKAQIKQSQLEVPFTKETLRAYNSVWDQSYEVLRHGEDWMLSWGAGSTSQVCVQGQAGQTELLWVTPGVRPLLYDGNIWTSTWFLGGRALIHLCDPAIAQMLIRNPVPGYYPSLAACTDPSLCEQEMAEFKQQMKTSVKDYLDLEDKNLKILQENIALQEKLNDLGKKAKKLEEEVSQLQQYKDGWGKSDAIIRRLEADLAVARSQIKGVDPSRI